MSGGKVRHRSRGQGKVKVRAWVLIWLRGLVRFMIRVWVRYVIFSRFVVEVSIGIRVRVGFGITVWVRLGVGLLVCNLKKSRLRVRIGVSGGVKIRG